jgi:hypothetical protein
MLATIMSANESNGPGALTPGIDWAKVKQGLPKTAGAQLDLIQQAYEAGTEEPAREVEIALRAKLAAFRLRFEQLKGASK